MQDTADVTRKLWSLCDVLRNEGVTYHEYLGELTSLLFLKIASELPTGDRIPREVQWQELISSDPVEALGRYRETLSKLAKSSDSTVSSIFTDTTTRIASPQSFQQLLRGIDEISWYREAQNGMGDVYEGLIEKNAQESRYGAGQYFTPRPVVEALVQVLAPRSTDTVYDPAAGTGGFLVAAGIAALDSDRKAPELSGVELVQDVRRMTLMNLILHNMAGHVKLGDALHQPPKKPGYSLILSNPPFGVRSGLTDRQNGFLEHQTSNKQLAFLQHIYSNLGTGGRAAVIVPDNVLFEGGIASAIRTKLLNEFRLHTVLTLPSGIFYATGIKTSVLFFCADGPTTDIWTYDLRTGARTFGKRARLSPADLSEFVATYGDDPLGRTQRQESARFTRVTRQDLPEGDKLDLGLSHAQPSVSEETSLESLSARIQAICVAIETARTSALEIADMVNTFNDGTSS